MSETVDVCTFVFNLIHVFIITNAVVVNREKRCRQDKIIQNRKRVTVKVI